MEKLNFSLLSCTDGRGVADLYELAAVGKMSLEPAWRRAGCTLSFVRHAVKQFTLLAPQLRLG